MHKIVNVRYSYVTSFVHDALLVVVVVVVVSACGLLSLNELKEGLTLLNKFVTVLEEVDDSVVLVVVPEASSFDCSWRGLGLNLLLGELNKETLFLCTVTGSFCSSILSFSIILLGACVVVVVGRTLLINDGLKALGRNRPFLGSSVVTVLKQNK